MYYSCSPCSLKALLLAAWDEADLAVAAAALAAAVVFQEAAADLAAAEQGVHGESGSIQSGRYKVGYKAGS